MCYNGFLKKGELLNIFEIGDISLEIKDKIPAFIKSKYLVFVTLYLLVTFWLNCVLMQFRLCYLYLISKFLHFINQRTYSITLFYKSSSKINFSA